MGIFHFREQLIKLLSVLDKGDDKDYAQKD